VERRRRREKKEDGSVTQCGRKKEKKIEKEKENKYGNIIYL
jgi:hypothetical protein